MLSRIGGGNSGIVYYLETGQKQGRELGRDDLDYRLCLDGNIEQLDHIIESIPDKGQERYLHISLSFHENQISEETLKAVCEEYKTLLMNAYDKDEYCFYAEAHIPKVKNVVDEKTGLLIERKPHIHIVIPEKNLVTGKHLNPRGRGEFNIKSLDAIQEHINNKFNLASPKDGVRVSDQNHANVLSRMKGDLFSEAKYEFKKTLISDIESKNIKTENDFLTHLSQFGEVKTYNQGKSNQYYGVKQPNETKFTRLKSPLFSKQFIETRTIPLIKPTPKQIEKALHEWCSKTSHEIKHIHPAGEKLRKSYAKSNDIEKANMLLTLRNQYNERNKLKREPREKLSRPLQRGRNTERGFNLNSQRTQSRPTQERLSSLQERNMVHELRGYGQRTTQQPNAVLSSHERSVIQNAEQERQHYRSGVRRTQDSGRRGRVTNPIQQTLLKLENKPTDNDLKLMKEIRQTIEPERFLSYCVSKYNIDPQLHKITFAKDNSPRFGVDKLNLNASDFLTKHLGLSWEDAKMDLLTINESQQKNEPFLSVLSRVPLNREQSKERTSSRENAKKSLNAFYREERKGLEIGYKTELKSLYAIKDHRKKEVERGFLMFNHLKDIESLNKITQAKRSTVNAIHNHWKPNDLHQQELLKTVLTEKGNYTMNKIMNADTDFTFEKSVARKRQFNDFETQVKSGEKLTDLVAHKKDKEVEYLNQKTKEVVFKDTGTHIEAKSIISKNEAAMMLEYAEKKYGGALRLSGSEAFKETIALTAAEKGMKIILEPEKYHEMMLKEVTRLKDAQQQTNQEPKEQQTNTITENSDIKLDNQAKPEKDNAVKEVEFLRNGLVNDNIYRNSLMNTEQTEKINSATDQVLSGHINNDKFLTIKAEVNAEIIKERTGIDVPIQDLKNDFNDRLTPEKTETQQISKEIADLQNSESLNPLPNNHQPKATDQSKADLDADMTSKLAQEKTQDTAPTIDSKEFNKLIVVPVHKDDGFEKSVEFKVAFKHDDKMVTELKGITESDLSRMGINTKDIDMRKIEPVSINISKLPNANVESPLKHAEKQLNAHVEHMKSKSWSRSEFDALKEQRGKLESNVEKAKEQHAPEQSQQNEHKKTQEQNKGQSM